MADQPPDVSRYTTDQLLAAKKDLEQRLARFQRSFFERHGRNPNDAEREPAKPAIRRYRAICSELAAREAKKDTNNGLSGAVGEQAAGQAQIGGDIAKEATRRAAEEGKKGSAGGEAAGIAAGSGAADKVAGSSSMIGKMGSAAAMITPSAGMCDLLVSWGQFTAIFGDLTQSVTSQMSDTIPFFDLPSLAPWADTMSGIWPYLQMFNLDIRAFQASRHTRPSPPSPCTFPAHYPRADPHPRRAPPSLPCAPLPQIPLRTPRSGRPFRCTWTSTSSLPSAGARHTSASPSSSR